ncbi:hypothetical protein DOTSEDRAFT_71563 [Dothistroma septosporum NZE10]|uniref:BTB domain-containing protein n=1 Tax=Dothistroma septosporum (strain NZE10 / CBS 128990) TaxID=675120 RepID=N1PJS5_DOTSN|nr:hypothetical protein DOTSEDRAFT_71563 [Dothistroma septosporum NZE10]
MADANAEQAFLSAIAQLAQRADLSDFTIICKDKEWHVHRVILASHSSVLNRACSGEFMEGRKKKYDLSEYDVGQVEALIEYMYTLEYQISDDVSSLEELCLHINMCILADKYDIPCLKEFATTKSKSCIDDVAVIEMAKPVTLVYEAEGATAEIRKALVQDLVHYDVFHAQKSYERRRIFETLLESYPRFAIDIIRAQSEFRKRLEDEWRTSCIPTS